MASLFAHIVVPVTCKAVFGKSISNRLLFYACVASILPDADVIAFSLGIPYESAFGHRGFTHSVVFAVFIGFAGVILSRNLQSPRIIAFSVLFVATISHALLDALTNGGLGVALMWPFSDVRFFLPWQPIEVSPIGASRFFTQRGIDVIQSELIVVFLPAAIFVLSFKIFMRIRRG